MTPSLANFIKRFFSHYLPVQKGLAINTVVAYRDAIKLLLGYASDTLKKKVEELGVEDLDESLVLDFLDHVEKTRGCNPRTRNARLAAIRAFFGFIAREEPSLLLHCQTIHTIPLKRTEHKTVDYLEEKEMQALLNAVDLTSRTGLRDKALLLLLYNTGARVSEIVELKIPDLRLDGSAQVKLLGKGQKYRSCPLWPETVEALHDYLQTASPKRSGRPAALPQRQRLTPHPLRRAAHHWQICHHSQKPMPIPCRQTRQPPHHPPYHRHASAAGR